LIFSAPLRLCVQSTQTDNSLFVRRGGFFRVTLYGHRHYNPQ